MKFIRWISQVIIDKEDEYIFSSSDNKNIEIVINNTKMTNIDSQQSIQLPKVNHEIKITYKNSEGLNKIK
ncbi:hypothetical protein BH747_09875 [Enterococcus villorum]|uniref:Uncharacterized protein n=1 Tax=Enterococcus villorum TaxID=112904 RepID=A0A1V8YAE1_9ENTE|nr:hypothetical protein [Enterococcus villorum]OQO69569.1 hypothetical protein BH747_09875 [Enterococcus villorum]OQO72640.1 hypothetical protein BH744_11225 [Enterococcus villorum]